MTNYVLDGIDLSQLFDTAVQPISFAENPRDYVPTNGSIIYSVWDADKRFIYVGTSGLQKASDKRSPLSRIIGHASGRRSGDQFCVYIHDFYIVPRLIEEQSYIPKKGLLDKLTKDYIQTKLAYRFVHFTSDDSDVIVRSLENQIKSGVLGFAPQLNGTILPKA